VQPQRRAARRGPLTRRLVPVGADERQRPAVFRRASAGGPGWLTRWNDKWRAFHLVGGHRRADESFRYCCVREVAEELGLGEGADFRVGERPLARLEAAGGWPGKRLEATSEVW
jgi:hypothetical protein